MARRSRSRRASLKSSGISQHPSRRKLAFEPLEDRRLLAVAVVDTTLDVVDFSDGLTSLREAIFAANTVAGADTIEFAPTLTTGGQATILMEHGELQITEALTINGPGADLLTIDAQQQSRIFNITSTVGDFAINALKLTHGQTTGSSRFDANTTYSGGAIRSMTAQMLTLDGILVSSNSTTGDFACGGGVFAVGPISLSNSIVTANSTSGNGSHGGGIYTKDNLITLVSTISANTVSDDESNGGGAFVQGETSITGSRFSENAINGFGNGAAVMSMGYCILVESEISGNSTSGIAGSALYAKLGADLTDTHILDNLSGGIATDFGIHRVVNLLRSEVSGHSKPAGHFGGGGVFTQGTVNLQQSIVTGNHISGNRMKGGGIYARYGFAAIDSVISDNSTTGIDAGGGGVFAGGGGAFATLSNTRVENNSTHGASSSGGGILTFYLTADSGSVISGNRTSGVGALGGGVYAQKATLEEVVVRDNYTTEDWSGGGGVSAREVAISNSIVEGNTTAGDSSPGGAIYQSGGKLTITNSLVSGNSTMGDLSGGGAINGNIEILITAVDFVGNQTRGRMSPGGAMFLTATSFDISRCAIAENGTLGINSDGGGVYSDTGGMRIESSTIAGNYTVGDDSDGGGVRGAGVEFLNSTVSNNSTMGDRSKGGGIFARAGVLLSQSTVSGNRTAGMASHGGGIATGSISSMFSTIIENEAIDSASYAGGVWATSSIAGSQTIVGTILARNNAIGGSPDIHAPSLFSGVKYSLIGDKSGTSLIESPIGSPDAKGNLIGGPVNGAIDPKVGPLANNGGPTQTHALVVGSPAIDAGDPAAVAGVGDVPEFDQRGAPWARVVGGRIDMGAIESQANPLGGDYNFNGRVDAADYTVWRNTLGSTNDLRADGSGEVVGVPDGVVDALDYAFWKANYGSVLGGGGGAASTALAEPVAHREEVALAGELRLTGVAAVVPARRSSPASEVVANASSRLRSDTALVAWLASRTAPKSLDDGAITSAAHDESVDAGEFCTALDRVFDLLGRAG